MRTALEVVTLYNLEVWNKGRFDLIPELCADQIVRHDANTVTVLDLDEQIARIRHNFEELRPTFEPVVLAGDDQFITLVWNVTGRDPHWKWCGIEIFRVENGKIVEVWNSPYVDGRWSQQGALWAGYSKGEPVLLPSMSAAFTAQGAALEVPLDSRGIATWLGLAFGTPHTTKVADGLWEHSFAPDGPDDMLSLLHAEGAAGASVLESVALDRLEIRWARSGLVNANVTVTGVPGTGHNPTAPARQRTTRLAECFGSFATATGDRARVVGASIIITGDAAACTGEVTLRFPATLDPAAVCGAGSLEFGWRHDGHELRFTGQAEIGHGEGAFEDKGEVEAVFTWRADRVVALLRNDLPGRDLPG